MIKSMENLTNNVFWVSFASHVYDLSLQLIGYKFEGTNASLLTLVDFPRQEMELNVILIRYFL